MVSSSSRRLGKRERERLQATLVEIAVQELVRLGAIPSERRTHPAFDGELNIETKAGLLRCRAYRSAVYDGIWIALRFEDVERACALINPKKRTSFPYDNGLNPFSGKWNMDSELLECTDPDDIRRRIQLKFAGVLPEVMR